MSGGLGHLRTQPARPTLKPLGSEPGHLPTPGSLTAKHVRGCLRTGPIGTRSWRRCGLERCAALRRSYKACRPAPSCTLFPTSCSIDLKPAHLDCHHEGPVPAGPAAAGRCREVSAAGPPPPAPAPALPAEPIARYGCIVPSNPRCHTSRNGAVRDGPPPAHSSPPFARPCGRPPRLPALRVLFGVSRGGRGIGVAA